MTQIRALLRGLAHRGSATLMIFIMALVAATAATMGPLYYAAAKTSILRDTVTTAPVSGRGFEVTQTGGIATLLPPLAAQVSAEVASDLGSRLAHRLFAPPVEALEVSAQSATIKAGIPLVWRGGAGVCAQLQISGRCPHARDQVIISTSLAAVAGWHTGQRLLFANWPALTVTGTYRPPDASRDYWFGRGSVYFPYEVGVSSARSAIASAYDAMFTPQATLTSGPPGAQGTAVYDDLLAAGRLGEGDVGRLRSGMTAVINSTLLASQQAVVTSAIPDTLGTVQSSWNTVSLPVVLITAQLLALTWLLLFLVVTDAAETRGPEIALAKLRGRGAWRTVAFGLAEPFALLVLAFPVGTLAGWGATAALSHSVLRPGTHVGVPPLGWATAAVATAGGMAAVALAARRTLRRPVVEQWRRAGRRAAERGWIVDTILVTGAAAALLDLAVSGRIGSARHDVLGLVVPGLLGVAVGVVASRLLPLGCRAAFGLTSRHGGVGGYLALRQLARRPGGIRTTMVLAVSFALAAFAVSAWSVGHGNYGLVAETQIGAQEVLTVSVPPGKELAAAVDHADPGGRLATAVDSYTSLASGSSGQTTLGVDPQRFARIAAWRSSFSATSLPRLAAQLAPPEPPPVTLAGDRLRVTVTVGTLSPARSDLVADVHVPGSPGVTPVDLGSLPSRGAVTLSGQLVGCPCTLHDLYVSAPASAVPLPTAGIIQLTGLQVHSGGGVGWRSLPGLLGDAARWRATTNDNPPDLLTAGPGGLQWRFSSRPGQIPAIAPVDRPAVLPAIASAALTGGRRGNFRGIGIDGSPLDIHVIAAAAAVPGAPAYGVIVDRRYAELAAGGNLSQVTPEVWLAAGARRLIQPRLEAAGVRVLSAESAAGLTALFSRQGPGLDSVLFLADAAAAALLAAGAAILGLYVSARRRRYEYAALAASGVAVRTLRAALVTEQSVVLGFGTVVGLCTGVAAAFLVLRSVPEFITQPAAPPLSFTPSAGQLATLLGIAVAALLAAAVTASGTLIHGVDLEQLREAPP